MTIEVTSVPDCGFGSDSYFRRFCTLVQNHRRLLLKLATVSAMLAIILAAGSLLKSYQFYARIVDERLEHGYLTSRPGLYANPRSLSVGQTITPEKLVTILRRAGYVESTASDVWNGSFTHAGSSVEIRPSRSGNAIGRVIKISFADNKIAEILADQQSIQSFTLAPEVLSNDLSSKPGKRETLNFGDIPPVLVHAILSIEDQRFFDHSGVDLSGLLRALLRNADEERFGQGGSTITQQLIKNTYLSPEKTFKRKYAEAMLSMALERRLSKEDIFALYCNEIYLGQRGATTIRGVRSAAQNLFGVELKDVNLVQAATIAGMIQGPARYSPMQHPDATRERRNLVLGSMLRDGWISIDEMKSAASAPVEITPLRASDSLAPYFIDYVNRVAENEFKSNGASQRIYTTIDLELQQIAETAIRNQLTALEKARPGKQPQAALVALDPTTGDVLAMVGGRSYAESQLNRVTDARRQPGSTFKPFVYAAALEDGMSPVQTFLDAPREFVYDRNKIYKPANYGGGYSMGDVTMRTGLVKSLNVVTVDLALRTGLARIANLAQRFGLPRPERFPSLALGTEEVTPLQLAAAYAVFVNGGRKVDPRVIAGIDEPPATHQQLSDEQVISPTTAYMITNMLGAVIERGTGRKARGAIRGTAVAGKTGTSRDGWFVGYSPHLVCAVWIGFDDNTELDLTGADSALPVWTDFMREAIAFRPDLGGERFECPEGIKFVEIDSQTGLIATVTCPLRELIAVTDRSAPHLECYLHGNLPVQGNPFAEEEQVDQSALAQSRKPVTRDVTPYPSNYRGTRTDVDAHGRRTLVNDMR